MDRKKPSTKQLEYFLAVAEASSFRQAAERLRISQPTLTAQIASLEKLLGSQLFERSRSGSRLSPVGRTILPNARRILSELETFVEASDPSRLGESGTYRLGVTPTLGPYLLPHLLPPLHEHYKELRFFIREEDPRTVEGGLVDGKYDLVITTLPLNSDELTVVPITREPVKLVVPSEHRLAGQRALAAESLRGADVLAIEEHHLFFRQVEQLCERFGARVLRDYEGTSLDSLRQMVVMGLGVAFLPALYIRSEIHAQSGLDVTDIAGESIVRIHALAWRPSSPARVFFQRLAGEIQSILSEQLSDILLPVEPVSAPSS